MPITKSITIDTPAKTVWAVLYDRLENMEDYHAEVAYCELEKRAAGGYLRRMEMGDNQITELVHIDREAGTIKQGLVKHPHFKGSILTKVSEQGGATELTLEQGWEPTSAMAQGTDLAPNVEATLRQIKQTAEDAPEDIEDKLSADDTGEA